MPIVICGNNKDLDMYNLIENNIKKYYNLSLIENNSFINPDQIHKNMIDIHFCKDIPEFKCSSGILVFLSSFEGRSDNNIPHGVICILDSSNKNAIKALSEKNVQAVTCGISSKDTVSIASLDFPRIAVSLQRSISSLSGKMIEPRENIIILKKEYDIYPILVSYLISLIFEILE